MAVILDGEGVGEGERGLVGRATARVTYEESATGVATSTSARAKASSRDFFAVPSVTCARGGERRRVTLYSTLALRPERNERSNLQLLAATTFQPDIFTIRAISDSDVLYRIDFAPSPCVAASIASPLPSNRTSSAPFPRNPAASRRDPRFPRDSYPSLDAFSRVNPTFLDSYPDRSRASRINITRVKRRTRSVRGKGQGGRGITCNLLGTRWNMCGLVGSHDFQLNTPCIE